MLDFITVEVIPIGRAGMLNPCDDKIFLNVRYLILGDEKTISKFIFFYEKISSSTLDEFLHIIT